VGTKARPQLKVLRLVKGAPGGGFRWLVRCKLSTNVA
jgi:hypothetical protein